MTMTTSDNPPANGRVPRMSISSMCRDEFHRRCKDIGMVCACDCHGGGQAAKPVAGTGPKTSRARKAVRNPNHESRIMNREPAPALRPAKPAKPAKRQPLVELVKADPPPPKPKPAKPTIAEQVRPLLEQLLVDDDRDWHRVVLFFSARAAAMNLKRLTAAHSRSEWEWTARQIDDVDQSAIYVRWVGRVRQVL